MGMPSIHSIPSGLYSEEPPVEPQELLISGTAVRDSPSNSSTSPELPKEPRSSDVTESTSTTILTSKTSHSSEPRATSLGAESLESVTRLLGSTLLLTENEKDSTCPSGRSSSSEFFLLSPSSEGQNRTPLTDRGSYNEDESNNNSRASSPMPDGYITPLFPLASPNYPLLTVPHLPYTGYTAITIPSYPHPPLPEKQCVGSLQDPSTSASTISSSTASSTSSSQASITLSPTADARQKVSPERENRVSARFVQDTSKFWYKPGISRDQGEENRPFGVILGDLL